MGGGGCLGGSEELVFTIQLSLQCDVFSRAVMEVKSLSSLFSMGGEGTCRHWI